MSFDPALIEALRHAAPSLARGIIAATHYRPHPDWDLMPAWMRSAWDFCCTLRARGRNFVAYSRCRSAGAGAVLARARFRAAAADLDGAHAEADRQRAARWADQMIFEGFRP